MKKISKILTLIITFLFTLSIGINIYADVINVIEGYHQVINVGGENDTNTIGEKDGVKVSKTISETDIENYFDITLKVNTTSNINEILKDQDLAIVIVMDISNTMAEGKVGNVTRYEAAMAAGTDFINKFAEYSEGTTASRQIGYVSFNTNSQQIFALQDCKTAAKAETLISTMKTKTGEIINKDGYAASHNRFTNIESGLKRAKNMLSKTTIKNKYIILLSDGFPTTYIDEKETYKGYDPYMSEKDKLPTSSSPGNFYNEIHGLPCKHGTDYSDRAAIKAREMATSIKDSGIKIFSVGTGLDQQKTITYYMDEDKKRINNTGKYKFATVDTETTNYEIGNSIQSYKDWLKNSIGSGYYYDTTSTAQLKAAYQAIFEQVKEMSKESAEAVWVVEDPMGTDESVKNIEFLGLYDDLNSKNSLHDSLNSNLENQSDTASFANNKISWDLKNSTYETITEGTKTHYIYEVKYRIRLQNELDSFTLNKIYDTNGTTTLTYVIRTNSILSENKYINFPIPKVIGYLGELTFTKKSSYDNTDLSGVKFELTHDENCKCHQEKKYATINKFEAISNEQGTVTLTNIPSGHTYKLKEIETQNDYILSNQIYDITVSYGNTSGIPLTNIITNDIKKSTLEIRKVIEGNKENAPTFKFSIELWFKGTPLTGEFNYKINNGETKVINIGTDIIELNNNDSMIIYDLPVGTTYKIEEILTDGYEVQYELNSNNREDGNIVSCNQENSCRIEEGNVNKVKFINITGFILPATGSSGTLILSIIGLLLLIIPVIYIGYMFYKNEKEDKLTSNI